MTGIVTAPEKATPGKYWLDKNGTAYKVSDHLLGAQYAQADSDEYERPMKWGYEDMFRHNWVRIDIENRGGISMWADCGSGKAPNHKQRSWINDAKARLEREYGGDIQVSTGRRLSGKALADSLTPGRASFLAELKKEAKDG